jgi:V/A-type H+/Na+-transporting ATPase subunit D
MPKVKLSKSALQVQRTQLQLYRRLLPSLDMKRRQLTLEHEKARGQFEQLQRSVDELETSIGRELPMLASTSVDLSGLVALKKCVLAEENVVGVRLPVLKAIEVEVEPYSKVVTPPWVDQFVRRLRDAVEERLRLDVAKHRIAILGKQLRQVTQRVNLFERILIPQAKSNIRRIRIFLGDLERDAVVRSKLAKSHGLSVVVEDAT